jgi:uracil-DNA glycosylase
MTDVAAERRALLAQVAGYLAWEQELGGTFVPSVSAPPLSAPAPTPSAPFPSPAPPPSRPTPTPHAPPTSGVPNTRLPGPELGRRLALIDADVKTCTRCELHKGRTQTVFARGNPEADLVFVGEGPGQEEDRTGQPFVGAAGQLLDKMVAAMGLARDAVYICNIVKCRPPGNRTPLPSEAGACAGYLEAQLELIRPRVIVALGRCAAENMGLVAGGGWRGRWGRYRGYEVMPTYHPAFLLRSPEFKRPVWEDLQRVMAKLKG